MSETLLETKAQLINETTWDKSPREVMMTKNFVAQNYRKNAASLRM